VGTTVRLRRGRGAANLLDLTGVRELLTEDDGRGPRTGRTDGEGFVAVAAARKACQR
jgi:hypothetical protein